MTDPSRLASLTSPGRLWPFPALPENEVSDLYRPRRRRYQRRHDRILPAPEWRGTRQRRGACREYAGRSGRRGFTVLIIFGLRVFFRTLGQGVFTAVAAAATARTVTGGGACGSRRPSCQPFRCNAVGEHVQCATCKTRYVTDGAPAEPSTTATSQGRPCGRHVRCYIGHAAGPVDPSNPASRQRAIQGGHRGRACRTTTRWMLQRLPDGSRSRRSARP